MKHSRFLRATIAIAMMLIGWLPSLAHDFEVDGIYYKKINDTEVEVTYKGTYASSYDYGYVGNVVIPESVTYNQTVYAVTLIGESAFQYCSGLTNIEISNSVTKIGNYAFSDCKSLTSIDIPNSVTSIGNWVFNRCSELTSVVIGNSVTFIGSFPFLECLGLTRIVVKEGNSVYDSRENCNAIIETASNTLILGCKNSIIPNSVTLIGDRAFSDCSELTSIDIPNSVTSIGFAAFDGCSSLTSIEIPNSVTSIGNYAFDGCSDLTSITIGSSITSIGYYAFDGCSSLKSVIWNAKKCADFYYDHKQFNGCSNITSFEFGEDVEHIPAYICNGLSSLTSVTIGNSVTSIGRFAFDDCSGLTCIDIPNSVTLIEYGAFRGCSGLTSIAIGSSITSIGYYAFNGCSNLKSVIWNAKNCADLIHSQNKETQFAGCSNVTSFEFGEDVEHIPANICSGLSSLTSVTIDNSVTSIGEYAFCDCSGLTYIDIPNSVTSIGHSAFSGCDGLTSIKIPNSITSIGNYAFFGCDGLTSIIVEVGNTMYDSRENCNAIIETASNTLVFGCKNSKIPNSVTSIGDNAFYGSTGLTSVTIGNSVTSIGRYAFYYCSGLTYIDIPNSVTLIGDRAFSYCSELTSIDIPNSVISIGVAAFYGCSGLTSIEIPNSVTSIGNYAFDGCDGLTSIKCVAEIPPTIDRYTFSNYSCELLVPYGSKSTYESAEYWSKFSNIVEFAIDRFFIDDFSINASETKVLAINLKNDIAFSGFQADLYLPEGLEVVIDNGNYSFELTDRKGSDHVLSAVKQSNGAIRLLCYSITNKEFSGTEGALVKFNVKASDDFVGEHEISIKDIEFTQKDETKYELESTTAKVEGRMVAKSITLNKTEIALEATQTTTLIATVLPDNTYNKVVTWKSSDETIATVDENGKVTAIKVGEATITATTTDGTNLFASCKVIVNPTLATSITLDKSEVELEATQTATLVATVLPELTTNKAVTWASSNDEVAIVDENGVVTAIAVGEVTITATTTDGSNLSASCKVIVKPTQATSITLNKTEASLKVTETITLVATVLPELTTNKSVTWKSSNNAVATVSENGVVTAVATGEAIITATTTDGSNLSASAKIIVDPTLAESVTLNIDKVTLKANETIELTATVLPELCTNKSVAWQSSDDKVAVVDANGLVTAIGVGEATITATTTDGSNLSATCTITVEATPGDANNDGNVNVTDVITVASHILGFNPNPFIFDAADINKDGKISITDIVAIVNIILNSETTNEVAHYARAAKQQAVGSSLFIEDCSIQEGETKTIAINLTNDITFSGFQADIKLPEGLELCQEDGEYMISLSDRKGNDHVLASAMRSNGSIRLLSYSMGLNEFEGTEGALVYLTVKAANNFVGDYEICINNITFTQANLTEYSLEPTICHLTSTTGINDVDGEVIVATVGNDIVVKNVAIDSIVRAYTADGALIASEIATDGSVVIEAPIKGIYLVKVGIQTVKVII